jgi:hypothetical protein
VTHTSKLLEQIEALEKSAEETVTRDLRDIAAEHLDGAINKGARVVTDGDGWTCESVLEFYINGQWQRSAAVSESVREFLRDVERLSLAVGSPLCVTYVV